MRIENRYRLLSPLSHIGESLSTGALFNMIQTAWGKMPIVTGNAVRGILRDHGAKHLLDMLGIKVNKEIFNVLFSGGNLSGASKQDVKRAREIRQHFPFVSMFGGGVGSMLLSGKFKCGNLYPICKESQEITGIESDKSWRDMIDEISYTRTDDAKNDKYSEYIIDADAETKAKASTQMRYTVQYLAPGTELWQEIIIDPTATDAEIGALLSAIRAWFDMPYLGGMSNKGFGSFDGVAVIDDALLDAPAAMTGIVKQIAPITHSWVEKYNDGISSSAEYLNLLEA